MKKIKHLAGRIYIFSKIYGIFNAIKIALTLSFHKEEHIAITLPGIAYPIKLRSGTSDVPTFIQVFIERSYNIRPEAEPTTIIDAGANIGLSSIYFANEYPNAKVIAIEPEESNYRLLEENVAHYSNILPMQKALSNQKELLNVMDGGAGNWGFTTSKQESQQTALRKNVVESVTIPEIMETYAIKWIDIMKIDIEGYEKELFSSDYQEWLPYCKMLVIELHDWMKLGCSTNFFKAISQYDFRFSRKGENLVFKNNANF